MSTRGVLSHRPLLQRPSKPSAVASPVRTQLEWFAGGAFVGFAVPYLGTSVFDLHHDLYLGVYFAAVALLVGAYVRASGVDVAAALRRNRRLNAAVGAALAVFLVANVLSETSTARPDGLYFAFELVWRGGLYGLADGILLTAFPCMVVYAAMGGRLATWPRRLGFAVATLALVMTITATYHLGYAQYREDGVGVAERGNVIMSIPALVTANPLASVVDHAIMHVSAVVHEYETPDRLPPRTEA